MYSKRVHLVAKGINVTGFFDYNFFFFFEYSHEVIVHLEREG